MTEADFARQMDVLAPVVDEANRETGDPLSYFEISTAMAFLYFREKRVDAAVVEVGMGGVWDATNVVRPDVAVITNIGLDHAAELGPDRAAIAREKAGVIKAGATLITAESDPEMLAIFSERCEQKRVEMKVLGRDFKVLFHVSYGLNSGKLGQAFGVQGLLRSYDQLYLPLLGDFHVKNAACAIAAVEAFVKNSTQIDALQVEQGLANVTSPGRMEVVGRDPLVILDGAHNPDGAEKLASVLANDLDYDELYLVIGILEDKDYREMLDILVPLADTVVVTRSNSQRAAPVETLARIVEVEHKKRCVAVESIGEAVKKAKTLASVSDMICVTGSLYTVGEARDALGLHPA